ncbi:hypothetical protein HZA98_01970 [Candidatus Woesearchaeota archaeon]|nr:hypothetical protein [Candidatus Woesearchaeota archaeon]
MDYEGNFYSLRDFLRNTDFGKLLRSDARTSLSSSTALDGHIHLYKLNTLVGSSDISLTREEVERRGFFDTLFGFFRGYHFMERVIEPGTIFRVPQHCYSGLQVLFSCCPQERKLENISDSAGWNGDDDLDGFALREMRRAFDNLSRLGVLSRVDYGEGLQDYARYSLVENTDNFKVQLKKR